MTEKERIERFDKSLFSIFASYFKQHKWLLVLDLVCAVLVSAITLIFPMVSRYALQNILPTKNYLLFTYIMIGLLLSLILKTIFQFIVTYQGHLMGVKMEADMRHDLFVHISHMDFTFFDKHRTGSLLSRVVSDLFEISELAHHGPEMLLTSIITLVGSFVFMLMIQWELALVLFVLIPLIILLVSVMRRKLEKSSMKLKKTTANINSDIESSISGIRTAKAFNNEDLEIEKFNSANELYKEARQNFFRIMGMFHGGIMGLSGVLTLVIIAVGGYFVALNKMTVVDLMTFIIFVNAFLMPINQMVAFFEIFSNGKAGLTRFVEIMRTNPSIADSDDLLDIYPLQGDIVYKNVSFSYEDSHSKNTVLKDINLEVKQGEKLAVVGPSGSGKTTLCQLLVRFYEINSGEISIGGHDIRDLTISSLREQVGIVQQDVFIFADSILENIRYGRPDATKQEVIQAAKNAEIHDFIMTLPQGYDTVVGERGITLSGGQRQRLSIARIFLKNPPFMILDEATSALDNKSEAIVQTSLEKLSKGRTTLTIAHRLSTIINADEILVLTYDGIAERGSHKELLAKKGVYYNLYNSNNEELFG